MPAYVSLFRGINVGGNHKVSMAELKKVHEALGLKNVVPYIQSGNVVFHSDEADAAQLQRQIETAFEAAFGFHSDVMIRTPAELAEIIARTPFQNQPDKEPRLLHVIFLAACPEQAAQEALLKTYVGPEEIFIIGQEMYIYYPQGAGRSKLTGSLIERKLKTVGTARNWNTVLQLQKMMQPT
jgi:uncharacterized protein (DUF1697 family)